MDLVVPALSPPLHAWAVPVGEAAIHGSSADQGELRILNAGRIPAEVRAVMIESRQIVFARGGNSDVVRSVEAWTSCPTSPPEAS
jgi:hypothetical protein